MLAHRRQLASTRGVSDLLWRSAGTLLPKVGEFDVTTLSTAGAQDQSLMRRQGRVLLLHVAPSCPFRGCYSPSGEGGYHGCFESAARSPVS